MIANGITRRSITGRAAEWATYQWGVVGRTQKDIGADLGCEGASISQAITAFLMAKLGWQVVHNTFDRQPLARALFTRVLAPPSPLGRNALNPRGPDEALSLGVAALRWSISGPLRDQLIHMARQDGWTLKSLSAVWGISMPRVTEIDRRQERRVRACLRGLPDPDAYPRAHLAVPIEMDAGLDYRDRWISFVIRNGVQALRDPGD